MILSVVRRYLRYLVIALFGLLVLFVTLGILRKLYEVSGLKRLRLRNRAESEDDRSLEGGSARRLLETTGADDNGVAEDTRPSSRSGKRQHSNSDSESTLANVTNLSRTKSEVKTVDEQVRRQRTLSESGMTQPFKASAQNLSGLEREVSRASDSSQPNSMMRQSSQGLSSKPVKRLMADLGTRISASSTQEHNINHLKSEARPEKDNLAADSSSSNPETLMAASEALDEQFDDAEDAEDYHEKSSSRRGSKARLLIVLPFVVASGWAFLAFACAEAWINESTCLATMSHVSILTKGLEAQLSGMEIPFGLEHFLADLLPTFNDNRTRVNSGDGDGSESPPLIPVALGLIFVLLLSSSTLCNRRRPARTTKKALRLTESLVSTSTKSVDGKGDSEKVGSVTPNSQTSARFTPRNGKSVASLDYPSFFASKLEDTGLTCFKCDSSKGVDLPGEQLYRNVIDQSTAFCIIITDDDFGRARCMEELQYALHTKGIHGVAVVLLDNAIVDKAPSAFQELLSTVPFIVTWPSNFLKLARGVFEEERKAICAITDFVRSRKLNKKTRYLWDVYVSHFRSSNHETLDRSLLSTLQSSSMIDSLASVVGAISDPASVRYATKLVESLVAARSITTVEGSVLISVLQSRDQHDQGRFFPAGSATHSVGSVNEVPVSPHRLIEVEGLGESTLPHPAELKFLNTTAETARRLSLSEKSEA